MKSEYLHRYRLGNKFGNVPKKFNGIIYHSTLEADYAAVLNLLLKGGELKLVERQPKYKLIVNGKDICNIIPDFLVVTKDGNEEIHEVKGKETDLWRYKWRLMQALYPHLTYRLIKKGDF